MILTVLIRDDGPMIHCGDSPSYRSVQLKLTDEQIVALSRRQTHSSGGVEYFEQYSRCFIEEAPQNAMEQNGHIAQQPQQSSAVDKE